MKLLKFFIAGILLGIVLTKSEAVSWYRIHEMFRFESFHMFGIIMVAILTGIVGMQIIKRKNVKDILGYPIILPEKEKGFTRYIVGGIFFGLGWGLVGACPGPIFVLLGTGVYSIAIVLLGALVGTFLYGILSKKLPN
ncbi:MAG: YeeE/YedE thiosulfate transporter family protein [Flavobacteriaceae bacterium]|jgi:uncharacterized membrane protein YedE/YeeE|nr:YeeE/YedE thiosulfate transporter family protein [Flavobacteriaceae bacterium]